MNEKICRLCKKKIKNKQEFIKRDFMKRIFPYTTTIRYWHTDCIYPKNE